MEKWRYFGRNGGFGKPFEIYRIPANGKRFSEQSESAVEKLHRDGTWAHHPEAKNGIWRELFMGDFSEELDELPEEEVKRLYQEWSVGNWPGRG
jgi:hypothetical protein